MHVCVYLYIYIYIYIYTHNKNTHYTHITTWSPPYYVKPFECLEKRYINVTNDYYEKKNIYFGSN